ncbi:MAG: HD domain-containing protein, partial [Alphaproteobacteria bacterium]
AIDRALAPTLDERYRYCDDFGKQLKRFFIMFPPWNLTLALNDCLTPSQFGRFRYRLRIPVSGSVLISREIEKIIDLPEFQRLRGVRQLGPTMFVFPGANHTRFEHSLGTYDLSVKYLERVLRSPHGQHLDENLENSIKLIALGALLHDIGHYPYSHWVEEIDEFPDRKKFPAHEDRARNIITKGQLADVISNVWKMDPNRVADVIAEGAVDDGLGILASSFINSAIDVDKVDYLIRDSIHCGVDYGRGIDAERLFDSLYVDTKNDCICITEKGLTPLLSLLTCRNIMYEAIYWHKTVRACEAMFKRFFYELIGRKLISSKKMERYLLFSDDAFTKAIYDASRGDKSLRVLMKPFVFQERSIYKPAYIYNEGQTLKGSPATEAFFMHALSVSKVYKRMVSLSNKLVKEVRKIIGKLGEFDLLLETTPTKSQHTAYELGKLRVWHTRKKDFLPLPAAIVETNKYLDSNRQAFIFCNPLHYEAFKEIVASGRLNKILGNIIGK